MVARHTDHVFIARCTAVTISSAFIATTFSIWCKYEQAQYYDARERFKHCSVGLSVQDQLHYSLGCVG